MCSSGLKTQISNPSPPKESACSFLGWMGSLPVGGVWQKRYLYHFLRCDFELSDRMIRERKSGVEGDGMLEKRDRTIAHAI